MPETLLLAIESTCDETAAAVIAEDLRVLGSVVASQTELHEQFRGVVPEIAARAHLERMLPVIAETLRRAWCELKDLSAVAVATQPGLAGSLLVGLSAAKALSLALGIPLLAVNHLHAHIYACRLAAGRDVFPCVGLIVSGGHTSLYRCAGPSEFELLGGTIDDAAGEAFDKVANMLGLPFPGGPAVSRCAEAGDPTAYRFPRSFIHEEDRLDFSFSGLKTAVRYQLAGTGRVNLSEVQVSEEERDNICASFQHAVIDCLVAKSLLAMKKANLARLCVGGGVAANRALRAALEAACAEFGAELIIAPMALCTDNAVMGAIALEQLKLGQTADLSLNISPGLQR